MVVNLLPPENSKERTQRESEDADDTHHQRTADISHVSKGDNATDGLDEVDNPADDDSGPNGEGSETELEHDGESLLV